MDRIKREINLFLLILFILSIPVKFFIF